MGTVIREQVKLIRDAIHDVSLVGINSSYYIILLINLFI